MIDKPRQSISLADGSSGRLRLALSVIVIGFVWLVVLPWIGSLPSVTAKQQWLESRGIDPSAMFYTELDAMAPILKRLERNKVNSQTRPEN